MDIGETTLTWVLRIYESHDRYAAKALHVTLSEGFCPRHRVPLDRDGHVAESRSHDGCDGAWAMHESGKAATFHLLEPEVRYVPEVMSVDRLIVGAGEGHE